MTMASWRHGLSVHYLWRIHGKEKYLCKRSQKTAAISQVAHELLAKRGYPLTEKTSVG